MAGRVTPRVRRPLCADGVACTRSFQGQPHGAKAQGQGLRPQMMERPHLDGRAGGVKGSRPAVSALGGPARCTSGFPPAGPGAMGRSVAPGPPSPSSVCLAHTQLWEASRGTRGSLPKISPTAYLNPFILNRKYRTWLCCFLPYK